MRPLILLSNDDGISALGLATLADRVADLGDVWVVAPDRERSATSHAISLDRPLRTDEVRPQWFAVDGTPVDCVYIAFHHLLPRRPDLCLSGINHGYNLGSDVFYSGTVAAAVEGAIRGAPSIAVSLGRAQGDFSHAAAFAHALAAATLREGLPPQTLLNVNLPAGPPRGYCWTRLGKRQYRDQVVERLDLRGRRYYWIGGPEIGAGDVPGSDCRAVQDGRASVTPLDLDLTHGGLLERLPDWQVHGFERAVAEDAAAPRG